MRIRHGWYDTGDMGVIDEEGYIWHRGRLKRFVKIGGEMVSMVKVETEITKLLSDDIECCVIEIPDPRKGARLAVVTTTEIEKNKIMKQLKDTLPQIAIPKIYMTLPELPKMGSGKIDFRSVTKTVRKNLIQQTVQKN